MGDDESHPGEVAELATSGEGPCQCEDRPLPAMVAENRGLRMMRPSQDFRWQAGVA